MSSDDLRETDADKAGLSATWWILNPVLVFVGAVVFLWDGEWAWGLFLLALTAFTAYVSVRKGR
jgi:ACR3 family arsenite efflux pump ArsB